MSFVTVPWDYVRYYLGRIFAAREACAARAGTMSDVWMRRYGYLPPTPPWHRRVLASAVTRWRVWRAARG